MIPILINTVRVFYLKKRPIITTISIFEKISAIPNVTLYLLSGHDGEDKIYKESEKNSWIDKHAPFFKKKIEFLTVQEFSIMNQIGLVKLNQLKR